MTNLLEARRRRGIATVAYEPPRRRTIVVAPHPDDETLAAGGLIARQTTSGIDVTIVAVTDGEAAYPSVNANVLARRRRREQRAAAEILGVSHRSLIRLGLPDGDIAGHEQRLDDLLERLVRPDDLVVAPWQHDWHPDHEACGRAALRVAEHVGASLVGSMFWAHHHPGPADDDRWTVATLHLTTGEVDRRARALRAYSSQFTSNDGSPILTPPLVEHLDGPFEHYVVVA